MMHTPIVKTRMTVIALALAVISVPVTAHAATPTPTPTPTTAAASLGKQPAAKQVAQAKNKVRTVLYSLTSNAGSLTPIAGAKNSYSLVLRKADPSTTWFTDRPYRDSGVLPTLDVAQAFSVTKDPPNVALVFHQPTQGTDTLVAVMRKSAFDANTQTFTAQIRILSTQQQSKVTAGLKRHVKRADTIIPATFKNPSLFIDTMYVGPAAPVYNNPPNPQNPNNPPNPQGGDAYQQMACMELVQEWLFFGSPLTWIQIDTPPWCPNSPPPTM